MKLRYLSINQLYEITGKDRRTIKKRLESLNPHSTDNRGEKYDAHAALELVYQPESTQGIDKKLQLEELRNQQQRNEKLELEIGEMRGRLVPIEDVAKAVEKEYTFVRTRFRTIPSKLAKPISMVTDPNQVQIRLQEAVDECLTELTADSKYEEDQRNLESARSETEEVSSDHETAAEIEPSSVGGLTQILEPGSE